MDSQGQWWQATGKNTGGRRPFPFPHAVYPLVDPLDSSSYVDRDRSDFMAFGARLWVPVLALSEGIPLRFLSVFALVLAVMPNNGLTLITIWKDVPFTISRCG